MRADLPPDVGPRQLRAVLALAEYRSFVAAAAALGVSQPTLTRTIGQVEERLGVRLFERNTRNVVVTPAGDAFAALAARVLDDLRIGVGALREMAGQARGQVVVSSVVSLADAVLPPLLAGYADRFPGVEIHLREGIQPAVSDDVRTGVADFGIGYVDDAPAAFVTEDLGPETFHLAMPAAHPLARRRRVRIEALAEVPMVSFPAQSRTRRLTDRAAAAQGLALRYVMTANRLPTLLGLVRNGVGLAVTPASERPPADDAVLVSRPLQGEGLACRFGLLRLDERALSAPAAAFMDIVRAWRRSGQRRPSGF